jgi:hypothetical protein
MGMEAGGRQRRQISVENGVDSRFRQEAQLFDLCQRLGAGLRANLVHGMLPFTHVAGAPP